jgi:hypothetical protein
LTSEQLQSARAERWRQVSNPVLTADDARAWLDGIGFCLFLSRRSHASGIASGPAPSFVEAVAGAPSEASSREAIENATALMHRLAAEGSVVPLNLSGAASAFGNGGAAGIGASDQPDFVVTRAALPYVFSLIGGRNWKSGPGAKASPLMTEVWTLLNEKGARTAAEIQTELGRELTEGAVLRALVELWHGLRVIPVYGDGTTRWELTQARFAAEMTASQKVAQTTALSALVSLYLEAAVAASSEEIETFLSPLASRSRVREVVNGLSATRQLGLISVAAQPLFHVAGSLPEFAEEEPVAADAEAGARKRPGSESREASFEHGPRTTREEGTGRKPFQRGVRSGGAAQRGARPQDGRDRGDRDRTERGGGAGFDRGRGGFSRDRGSRERTGPPRERTGSPRERTGPPRERSGYGRPSGERFAGKRSGDARFRSKESGERRPYRGPEDRGPQDRRPEDRRPSDGARTSYGKKPFGKSAGPGGSRPFDRERPGAAARERPSGGPRGGKFPAKKFGQGGARPWEARGAGRPTRAGESERPFRPRREEDAGSERGGERPAGKFGGAKKFDGPKFGAAKKFGGPGKFGSPKFGGRSGSGSRTSGPRTSGPRGLGSRTSGPRTAGPRTAGPRTAGPRTAGPGASGRTTGRGAAGPGSRSGGGSFSGGFKRESGGQKRPFFRERAREGGEGESRPREAGEGARPARREGGWKPKPSGGGFSKPGRPAFKSSGRPAFKGPGKPGFKGSGKPGFKSGGRAGFGKSAKPFGKSGKPGFGGKKPGGFKPPFRKRKDEGGENAG